MFKAQIFIFGIYLLNLCNGIKKIPPKPLIRHKLIMGLGVPLQLESEAVTYAWTVKAEYWFPATEKQIFQNFPGFARHYSQSSTKNLRQQHIQHSNSAFNVTTRKRREILIDEGTGKKYEKYDVEVEEIGNEALNDDNYYFDDQIDTEGMIPSLNDYLMGREENLMDTSGTRWLLYDGLARLLSMKGLEGRHCVLRAICEAAEKNFGYHDGLFGQLFHLFFTPSSTFDPIVNKDHFDYVQAESLGQAGEPCHRIFSKCNRSVLDIFTKVYEFF